MDDKNQPKSEAPQPIAPPPIAPIAPIQPAPAPAPAVGVTPTTPASGMAIASLVLGIISLFGGWVAFLGFGLGLTAFILGIVCLKKKAGGKGMAIAGIVTGSIAIVWNIIVSILFISLILIGAAGSAAIDEVDRNTRSFVSDYETEQQNKIDSKKNFTRGQTAVFDTLDVKVNLVTRNYVPESTYSKASSGNELIVVNLSVTNNSSTTEYVSSYGFKINENGLADSSSIWTTVAPEFEGGSLSPGATTTGNIVYEVTKDATGLKIQYEVYAYDTDAGESKTLVYTLAI